MGRRRLLLLLLTFSGLRAGTTGESLTGNLSRSADGKPVLKTKGGRTIPLEGDKDTEIVLQDDRLQGADFEVTGKFLDADRFEVGPIYRHSMLVLRGGKRFSISYWCDLCSIRNYTPGKCQCCQEETALDLREDPEK